MLENQQLSGQSVHQYRNETVKLTKREEATPAQTLQAALNGYNSQLFSHLVLQNIQNIDELRGKAIVAEKSLPAHESSSSVTDALQSIDRRLAAMAVNNVADDREHGSRYD